MKLFIILCSLPLFVAFTPLGATGKKTEKKQKQQSKFSSEKRFSLGVLGGYSTTYRSQQQSSGVSDQRDRFHTFAVGIYSEFEISSWFALRAQSYFTQHQTRFYNLEQNQNILFNFFYIDVLFQIVFFFRVQSFKFSYSYGAGPNFNLGPKKVVRFGVSDERAKYWFVGSHLVEIKLEYPSYEIFITSGVILGGGAYGVFPGYAPVVIGVGMSF